MLRIIIVAVAIAAAICFIPKSVVPVEPEPAQMLQLPAPAALTREVIEPDPMQEFVEEYIEKHLYANTKIDPELEELYVVDSMVKHGGFYTYKARVSTDYIPTLATWIIDASEETGASLYEMLAIARYESEFNTFCLGDYGKSYGTFQVMRKYHEKRFQGFSMEDSTGMILEDFDDPQDRIRYAGWKLSQNGHNAWTVWTKGYAKSESRRVKTALSNI